MCTDMADEAATLLEVIPRAGAELPETVNETVNVGPTQWPPKSTDGVRSPGAGTLMMGAMACTSFDYGEELDLSQAPDIAAVLHLPEPRPERRQCLLLSIAAGIQRARAEYWRRCCRRSPKTADQRRTCMRTVQVCSTARVLFPKRAR